MVQLKIQISDTASKAIRVLAVSKGWSVSDTVTILGEDLIHSGIIHLPEQNIKFESSPFLMKVLRDEGLSGGCIADSPKQ